MVSDHAVLQANGYRRLRELGAGTYGVVIKALQEKTGLMFAIKKVKLQIADDDGVPSTALREISILRLLQHPHIVILNEIIQYEDKLFMVLECLSKDLKSLLRSFNGKHIPTKLIKSLTYQLILGIEYCHSNRILHRDLKPQNLLIDVNGKLKLCDFGLARATNKQQKPYTREVVTLWYRCPEILLGSKMYDVGVDTWAIACIFLEILLRRPFFPGDSEIDQLYHIFRKVGTPNNNNWPGVEKLPFYSKCFPKWTGTNMSSIIDEKIFSHNAIDLVTKIMKINPADRLLANEIRDHPYFNGIDALLKNGSIKELFKKTFKLHM